LLPLPAFSCQNDSAAHGWPARTRSSWRIGSAIASKKRVLPVTV
jgi:hypothetical protein